MFSIKNNIITITKGDSAGIQVDLTFDNGTEYVMRNGDTLTMTVRKKFGSDILFQVISDNNIIDLSPMLTKKLEKGACVYDIELKTVTDDVFTVAGIDNDIYKTNMIVIDEVTV